MWLSHKHADHILGLPALLEARPLDSPPLLVVGPQEAADWLRAIAPQHSHWRFNFLHCSRFAGSSNWQGAIHGLDAHTMRAAGFAGSGGQGRAIGPDAHVMRAAGFAAWQSVPVLHCRDAYGLVLSHCQGWKLVYSGEACAAHVSVSFCALS